MVSLADEIGKPLEPVSYITVHGSNRKDLPIVYYCGDGGGESASREVLKSDLHA